MSVNSPRSNLLKVFNCYSCCTHDYFLNAWLNMEHSVPQCKVIVVGKGLVGLVVPAS